MQRKEEINFIKQNTSVNILGETYKILFKNYDDYPDFKRRNAAGLCDMHLKEINICNIESYPDYTKQEPERIDIAYKEIIRHEIMHAFLYESGLDGESHESNGWAADEEIVDWFAIQSPKIYKVFNELNLL